MNDAEDPDLQNTETGSLEGPPEGPKDGITLSLGRPDGEAGARPNNMLEMRLLAVMAAARFHGIELDRANMRVPRGAGAPEPAALVEWVRGAGLWARADRLSWRNLMKLRGGPPVVLLFNDGSAGLLVGVNAPRHVVLLKDPNAPQADPPVPVDELRLSRLWRGEAILIRPHRGLSEEDAPFDFSWILRLVLKEKRLLRDMSVASITLSVLVIVPPLIIMMVINEVVVHHSMATLVMISLILLVCVIYETLLGYARRELIAVVATRLDSRLNLHIFQRLLALPLDYFERNPAGQTSHRVAQVYRVRDFITGKLLQTFLDFFTLFVLLPVLFYLQPALAWMVLAVSLLISMIIFCFLKPMRRVMGRVIRAEIEKSVVMIETVHGIRTVKSLALEPQQKDSWDYKVANAGAMRLEASRLSNWPNTIVTPLERFAERGVVLVGAYMFLSGDTSISVGALIAFMMLGQRVAQPLVGMARLLEDMEEVRSAVYEIGLVMNNPLETSAAGVSKMRPKFEGAIKVEDLTFTYAGTKTPALKEVSFEVPAGTMLGVVGRSGSGKSTITRLLQGINRNYEGFLKIDGVELREVDLPHLRRSFGVVLQENFLFRGSVRDNIIAGRPGLTLEDAVRAARLAGAEEFVERMPQGYETFIEEGSPNLSGGQRQRLAIARALICDPRLLILDEATSALDPESEALVNANIQRIGRGRTMVVVSHRLSSLTEMDQILVLEKGRVMDLAPHAVLVERCAVYRQLWLQQNRHLQPQTQQRPASMPPVLTTRRE